MPNRRLALSFLAVTLGGGCLLACSDPKPASGDAKPAPSASSEVPTAAAPPPAAAPERPRMPEPDEVREVVRLLWPFARRVEDADWRWAGCHDKTAGFEAVQACLKDALKQAEEQKAKMPGLRTASDCGKAVEAAHRRFIDGRIAYLKDTEAWMDKNTPRLKGALSGKPLGDLPSAPAGKPSSMSEAYGGGLMLITQNECLGRILSCPSLGCSSAVLNRLANLPDR